MTATASAVPETDTARKKAKSRIFGNVGYQKDIGPARLIHSDETSKIYMTYVNEYIHITRTPNNNEIRTIFEICPVENPSDCSIEEAQKGFREEFEMNLEALRTGKSPNPEKTKARVTSYLDNVITPSSRREEVSHEYASAGI